MRASDSMYFFCLYLVRGFLTLTCGLRVSGQQYIPKSGPVMIAANHTSYLDPPVVAVAAWRRVQFVGKEALFRIPLLGPLIAWLGAFPVARGRVDRRVFRTVEHLLNDGRAVLIFPEGTRSPDGRLLPMEAGIGFLARRTGAPIVPAAIIGAHRALPANSPFFRPARVEVHFGPPVTVVRGPASRAEVEAVTGRLQRALLDLLPAEMHPQEAPPVSAGARAR